MIYVARYLTKIKDKTITFKESYFAFMSARSFVVY